MTKIDVGEYTVWLNESPPEQFKFEATRYGEPWRSLVGDGLMLALVHRVLRLQEENARLQQEIEELEIECDSLDNETKEGRGD